MGMYGYYPEPSKSVLIVHLNNLSSGRGFGLRHGFKICMVARYLGGFIGDDESKCDCLKYRTSTWEKNILAFTETVWEFPQKSYADVVCAIQTE